MACGGAISWGQKWRALTVPVYLTKPELEQVLGFEFASGPTISLFVPNAYQVFHFVESAVNNLCPAAVGREFQRDFRTGRDGPFHFKTGSRRGNVLQNGPFALSRFGFRSPLNFDKVCAKFSIFSSFRCHDSFIGKIQPKFSATR
jgi:hypothetical protein